VHQNAQIYFLQGPWRGAIIGLGSGEAPGFRYSMRGRQLQPLFDPIEARFNPIDTAVGASHACHEARLRFVHISMRRSSFSSMRR
jgi:hypothetical protein